MQSSIARDARQAPRSPGNRPTDDDLLDIALPVVARVGCHAVTMDQIVKTGRTTKQTLYAHFGSKHSLINLLVTRELSTLRKVFEDSISVSQISVGNLLSGIMQTLRPVFAYTAQQPDSMRLLLDPAAPNASAARKAFIHDAIRWGLATEYASHTADAVTDGLVTLAMSMTAHAVDAAVLSALNNGLDKNTSVETCAKYIAAGLEAILRPIRDAEKAGLPQSTIQI